MTDGKITRYLAAAGTFAISLSVYLRTMLPGVGGYGDTSKFQFIGATLGLPHPSGFPTYIFVNALFARLPWGTLAWRINLMSAVFGALTVGMLSLTLSRLTRSAAAAVCCPLLFAFTFTFWSTCLVAEVYTLAFFFISATMYCLVVWRETARRKWFYLACLLYALSFGNHLMVIVLIPPFLLLVVATDRSIFRSPRAIGAVALIVLLGAAQYLYLPLRTLQGPEYREGAVSGLRELAWFATGGTFRRHYFEPTIRQAFTVYVPVYGRILRDQIGVWGIALAAAGFIPLFRRERVWGWFFLLLYAVTVGLYVNGPHIEQPIYFVPATMALAIPIASLASARAARAWRAVACTAICALAASLLLRNYAVEDLSGKTEYDAAADLVLGSVKPRSIILSPNYHWTEVFLYKLLGERAREGDEVYVLHFWEPEELGKYSRGNVSSWDPYLPKLSLPAEYNLYLLAFEPEPRSLRSVLKRGWRAEPVIRRENPLAAELRALDENTIMCAAVKDEGLTILSDEAYDALVAIGLKTRAVAGATFGWAAGDIVMRREGRWAGLQEFRYSPVLLRVRSATAIPGTACISPADMEVRCAGYGRGDRNEISVGGRKVTDSASGLNVALVDGRTGRVERVFDVPAARLGSLRSIYLYELTPGGD